MKASSPLSKQTPTKPIAKQRLMFVSFEKYQKGEAYCLSHCEERSVRAFTDCLRKVCSMTLFVLFQTGSKGAGKSGLAYTPYQDSALKGAKRHGGVPADKLICAVRAGDNDRLFGYIDDHVFYVLWFDSHHRIVPV